MNHIFNKFKRDITGIGWLTLVIFVSLSLVSFNPNDPSFNSIGHEHDIKNYCGYFGSFLSDILYQFMGLSSWVIVLAFMRLSLRSFRGQDNKTSKLRFIWSVLLICTSTSLGSLYWPEVKFFNQQIGIGGVLGDFISQNLLPVFNFAGLSVLLWACAVMLVVFYTEKPIRDLLKLPIEGAQEAGDVLSRVGQSSIVSAIFNFAKLWILKIKRPQLRHKKEMEEDVKKVFYPIINDGKKENKKSIFKLKKNQSENIEEEECEEEYEEGEDIVGEESEEEPSENQMSLFNLRSKKKKNIKRKVKLKTRVSRYVENWTLPKISLLEDPPLSRQKVESKEVKIKARLLTEKLAQFNVGGEVVGVKPGPAVTLFEFKPNIDVKISKITELADDLCLALSSESVRIIAPIPGRDVVGIETSNYHQETVYLKDNVADEDFWDESICLPIPLGRQADGENKVVDLRKMPHLLVAGTTGSGKSVFIVSTLTALLFKHSPKTLRLILVDPKQVDLAIFNSVPHLLMPPLREPQKAVTALRWAIREMEQRYRSMAKFGARGLEGFNEKISQLTKEQVEEHEAMNLDYEENNKRNESYYFTPQPYIVIVVEEFGDLMAVDKGNVEQGVVRLAQMARACGIHLILAMQSPRKDVVTGLIKTNIPGRISFKVASKLDSRVILDEAGGERLLARGDMLYLAPGVAKPERHHGAWLSEDEISSVVDFWSDQGTPDFDELALKALEGSGGGFELDGSESDTSDSEDGYDDRYDEVLAFVASQKSVSASLLQRRFRLGYPRAARIIEVMESEGVVGPANGSKPRQVLVKDYSSPE